MEGGGGGGGSTGGRAPMAEAHLYHRERRRDLMPLKLAVFDAMAAAAASSSPSASRNNGGSSRPPRQRPPICKLWALYRKSLRLFLIGELSKPELDAVVIYTLGEENGTFRQYTIYICTPMLFQNTSSFILSFYYGNSAPS